MSCVITVWWQLSRSMCVCRPGSSFLLFYFICFFFPLYSLCVCNTAFPVYIHSRRHFVVSVTFLSLTSTAKVPTKKKKNRKFQFDILKKKKEKAVGSLIQKSRLNAMSNWEKDAKKKGVYSMHPLIFVYIFFSYIIRQQENLKKKRRRRERKRGAPTKWTVIFSLSLFFFFSVTFLCCLV